MKIVLFIFCFCPILIKSQILFYQENCHCGVTGAGFSSLYSAGTDTIELEIAPGSIIKKAFLFGTEYWNNSIPNIEFNVLFNNSEFTFNTETRISSFDTGLAATAPNIFLHSIDITSELTSNDSLFIISTPNVNDCFGCVFSTVYLYILYENSNLNLTSSYILINNKNEQYSTDFQLNELNPITSNSDIGWAICASRLSEWSSGDGSLLTFNNGAIQAGLLQGEGNLVSDGPQGCFYFENDSLFGLSNDTPDEFVNGYDALLNAKDYLNPNQSITWNLTWGEYTSGVRYNIYNEFFIEHGTTCESMQANVSKDTSICANIALQLEASGGVAYEWSPAEHLSCSNCANPIFISDTSALLTVRIWSSDSCSVVRPVNIQVKPAPQIKSSTNTPSVCGMNSGTLTISMQPSSIQPLSYQIDQGSIQGSNSFMNLNSGAHMVKIIDGNGCEIDTLIEIPQINYTEAKFEFNTILGFANDEIEILNLSTNAKNFIWNLNDTNFILSNSKIKFLYPGEYKLELICYDFDINCSDTTTKWITIYSSIECFVPNVITPNNDLINDYFNIISSTELLYKVTILNRNGNKLYYNEGELKTGNNNIWDGKLEGKAIEDGTYFYNLELKLNDETLPTLFLGIREKSINGFFHVQN
jgi:gliding motility-associated-like protein